MSSNLPNSSVQTKSAVFLLGMHRSGTSALTRALGEMGLWVGDTGELLEAHPHDNPTGYFERRDIHDAHVQYLSTKGYDWNRLAGFRVDALDDSQGRTLASRLKTVVAGLDEHRPWLVKDPRLSLLLPFWRTLVPEHACVVAVRHPLEIAASLRNTPRGVYSTPFLLLLWQKYMTRMIADLAGRPAIFVAYQRVLDAPGHELGRLRHLLQASGVEGLSELGDEDASKLFDRKLRRQRVDDDANLLSQDQRNLYEWLLAASERNASCVVPTGQWPEPDAQLAEFEASADFFVAHGRGLGGADVAARLQQLETQNHAILEQALALRSTFQDQIELMRQRNETLEAKLGRVQKQRDRLKQELKTTRQGLHDTQTHAENIEANLRRSHEDHAGLTGHAARLEQALGEVKRSWSWRLSAPLRWPGQLLSLRLPAGLERWLYGAYYRMPGLGAKRKRMIILWLHENMPWLTRHTLSYQLYRAAKETAASPAARDRWLKPLTDEERQKMLAGLSRRPLISVVMPAYNTDPKWLGAAVDSLRAQSYPHWELCIADDASTRAESRRALDELDDGRIKLVRLDRNVGIALASNAALELAEGEYVALLDHDDELAPDALLEVAAAIDRDAADFVYTDEDKIDYDGQHVDAHFKPDYSPDLFFSCNYICHLSVIRRDLMMSAGGFRQGFDGAQDYDLFLRCLELAKTIVHIPKVLYHWRIHEKSTAAASAAKPKSWEAGRRALTEALARRDISGNVHLGPFPNTYRVRRELTSHPLVSIIIPFKDKYELLDACVDGILKKGSYEDIEILAVDNGSIERKTQAQLQSLLMRDERIRVLKYDVPFNYSKINNWAARQARGDVLLFLNNDIEPITEGWIGSMLEQVQRSEVAVVGARLLYPDDTVQHGGVIVGLGGVAGHAHLFASREHPGYFGRSKLNQNFSSVTFACAMVRRDVFNKLEGLNEERLTVAFNDVDFCLRARELGYLIVYDAFSELYHHESKSRGEDNTPEKSLRFNAEIAYMQTRHAKVLSEGDPYYNVNLSLLAHSSFSLDLS